ncbi:unnamed protein product [Gadus morhua 'NCC']
MRGDQTAEDYHTTETMDAITAQCGIISPGGQAADSHSGAVMWRPWDTPCGQNEAHKLNSNHGELHDAKHSKNLPITHPVKLYWPKSKCFDYLYQDAEVLLSNYPVQATICLYQEGGSGDEGSSGDEESSGDECSSWGELSDEEEDFEMGMN